MKLRLGICDLNSGRERIGAGTAMRFAIRNDRVMPGGDVPHETVKLLIIDLRRVSRAVRVLLVR